jgi:hypothetical protein
VILRTSLDPRSLGPIALWLDAADAPSVGLATDKSGNGRDASQKATNNQPVLVANSLNGRPALSFDGINDSLAISPFTISSWHAFVVCSPSASGGTVLYLPSTATESFSLTSGGSAAVLSGSGSPSSAAAIYGADGRVGAGWSGGALKAFYKGLVGEVIVYSASLSSGSAAAITRYLTRKWL